MFGITTRAYETGHLTLAFTDPSRADRPIPVEVVYPADAPGEAVPVASGEFPVVGFGHGFVIPGDDYPFLAAGLSSAGFIIVFVGTETGFSPDHADFGLDLAFIISSMKDLDAAPQSLFFGHIAVRACVMGHSMGGGAALLAAAGDPSIDAIVTLAAAETDPSAIAASATIHMPAFFVSGDQDCITPFEEHQFPMYQAMPSICRTIVQLTGASHCQFASNSSLCRAAELFSGCSATIDVALQESRTLALIVPWLDAILNQSSVAWTAFESQLDLGAQSGILVFQQDCDMPATPTPSPSSTPSQTPHPSATPQPSPSSAPSSPSATATPSCATTGVTLDISATSFHPDDLFSLTARLCNTDEAFRDVAFFTILEVLGVYYFAPAWSTGIDFVTLTIGSGETERVVIPEFLWPESAGAFSGAIFWGAMTDPDLHGLIGDFDRVEFGWGR